MSERKRHSSDQDDLRASWGPMDEEIWHPRQRARQRTRVSADEFDEMELNVNSQASWVSFLDEMETERELAEMEAFWNDTSLAHHATIEWANEINSETVGADPSVA